MIFRQLSADEEARFRAWARTNYRPGDPIDGCWHPVVGDEAKKMNAEPTVFVADRGEEDAS